MNEILKSEPDLNNGILKQKLRQLCRRASAGKVKEEIVEFFTRIVKKKEFKDVQYFIYLQLARLSVENRKKFLKKALANSSDDGERLESLMKLHEYHRVRGDLKREVLYIEKEAEIRKKYGDYNSLKQLYITLGNYHLRENNLLRSLQAFFEAIRYSERADIAKSGYIYNRIAKLFSLLGKNKLAIKFLGNSLTCAKNFKNEHLKMWIFNIFTELYISEADYTKAEQYNGMSIAIGKKNYYPELVLNAYFLKAKLFFYNNQEISGLMALKNAVDFGINNESHEHLIPVLYEFIKRATQYDNFEIASEYLEKISNTFSPFFRDYFFYYFLKAQLFEKMGKLEAAEDYYEKTFRSLNYFFSELDDLRHYPFRDEITFIYSKIARFNFRMFDKTNDLKYLRMAFYTGEVRNPYMFRRISDRDRRLTSITKEKSGVENEIRTLEKKRASLSLKNTAKNAIEKRIDSLRTELTELEDLILEFPKRYRRFTISDLDLKEIRNSIDPGTLVIRYIVLENSAYAFVLDSKSVGYKQLDKGSMYISNLNNALLLPIKRYENGEVDFLRTGYDMRKSEKLFKLLLYDVLEFHKQKKKLVIIPDRTLFRLPFEALITKRGTNSGNANVIFSEYENAEFLIDKYSIEYFLSVFHLKKNKRKTRKKFEISAFGYPVIDQNNRWLSDFSDTENGIYEQLPSSRKEIEKIKKIWGTRKSRYFTGRDFTRENFNRTATISSIIHLATHFISNHKYPWYSSFIFSPGRKKRPLYFVSEISKLKLNSDLVFLSTCGSLENHLMGEQLISGMTATLYNSGAGSMIASLWPVNEFSSGIIVPFYSALKNKKRLAGNLAEILRSVKRTFRKKKIDLGNGRKMSCSHPLIWANFNLYNFFIKI